MAKGKITQIEFTNTWTAPDGTVYKYHKVTMENGNEGKVAFKNDNQYVVGDEVEYTVNGDRLQISKVQPKQQTYMSKAPRNYNSSGKRSKEDYLGFVYGYAKDIHIAEMQITGKKVPLSHLKKNVEEMYAHIQELLMSE